MTTKQSGFVGGEQARRGEPLDNFGGRLTDGRPPPAEETKAAPAAEHDADAEIDAELDAEDAARAANLKRLGLADPVTAEKAPAATLASVERELAEVAARMRAARGAEYNSLDRRQLELIQTRLDLQAGKAPAADAAGEAEETDDEGTVDLSPAEKRLAELQEELAEIRSKARSSKGAERDALEARELELLREEQVTEAGLYVGEDVAADLVATWAEQGGVAHHVGVLAGMVKSISGALDDAGRDAFVTDLEALPAAVRKMTYAQFSTTGGSLKARLDAIERGLSGADLAAAQAFRAKHGEALRRGLVG